MSVFVWGAATWAIAVGLKFAIAVPFNPPLLRYLTIHFSNTAGTVVFSVYLGLLTGIFECLIPYFTIRFSRLKEYSYNDALAFGIGFGAFETILVGVYALLKTNGYVGSLLLLPVGSVERLSVIVIHAVVCMLLFVSIRQRQAKYLWFAVTIKTVIDGIAGAFLVSWNIRDVGAVWIHEVTVAVFALASLALVPALFRRYNANAKHIDHTSAISTT
jgi:uncharacterized membrane protein YhfC